MPLRLRCVHPAAIPVAQGDCGPILCRPGGRPPRRQNRKTKALFRSEKFLNFATVAVSFVCDKYYPIID